MGAGASTSEGDDNGARRQNEDEEHDDIWNKSNLRKRTVRHIQKMLEEKSKKKNSKRHLKKEKREVERKESKARLRKAKTHHKKQMNDISHVMEDQRPVPPSYKDAEDEEKIEDELLPPPPEDVKISNITPTSCDVSWRPPSVQNFKQAARNFIVQLKNVKTKNVSVAYYGPAWDHQLTNLEPRSLYSVRIACDNMHGAGEFSHYQAFRTIRLSGVGSAVTPKSEEKQSSSPKTRPPKKKRRKTLLTKELRLKRFRLMRALDPESTINRKNKPHVVLDIKRDTLLESSLRQLRSISQISWEQHPIRIIYFGEDGKGPGVNRDWYLQFSRKLFSPSDDLGMFLPSSHNSTHALGGDEAKYVPLLRVDVSSTTEKHLELWQLLGAFLAKSLRCRKLVEAPLPVRMWQAIVEGFETEPKNWSEEEILESRMSRVSREDPNLHRSLRWILDNKIDEDVLMQSFDVCVKAPRLEMYKEETINKGMSTVELIPGGSSISVCEENKFEYVSKYLDWYLHKSTSVQIENMLVGFSSVMSIAMLRSLEFSPRELQILANGDPFIDVETLMRQSICTHGLSSDSDVVKWFWEWMNNAGTLERQKLLEFATGSPRSPLDGFNPPFELKGTDEGPNTLPRAHTCFHQLVLPKYETKSQFLEKMTKALDYADRAGFQFL